MAKYAAELELTLGSEGGPAKIFARLNAIQPHFAGERRILFLDRFVTIGIAIIDPDRHEVHYANAGHLLAPALVRCYDGEVVPVGLDKTSRALDVTNELYCEQVMVKLAPGDCLVMFTDGISQAINTGGELYGLNRIIKHIGGPVDNVRQLGERIIRDVKQFTGNQPQKDDGSLLCFGRNH